MSDEKHLKAIERSIRDIRQLLPRVIATINAVGDQLDRLGVKISENERKYSASYWKRYAYEHLLIKIRILIENNFRYIESLSLLATSRYIFEALVWARTIQKDERYSLVLYHQLAVYPYPVSTGSAYWRRDVADVDAEHEPRELPFLPLASL